MRATQAKVFYTTSDVRNLIEADRTAEALDVLRWVLQNNPSADAWFLAAVYTEAERQKINHLRRGLLLDPAHRGCRALMARYTTTYPGWGAFILDEITHEIRRQCNRSIVLKRLPPRFRVAAVGLLFTALIAGFAILLLLVGGQLAARPRFAANAPQAAPVTLVTSDQIVDQFSTSEVGRVRIERSQNPAQPDKQSITLALEGRDTSVPIAEILVYDSVSALIADRNYLAEHARGSNVVALPNAVMIYDRRLSEAIASDLRRTFRQLGPREDNRVTTL